ncbi:MAG: hypothetical protein ACI4D9_00770 [Lachnospiraceae bacterium]
MQDIEYLKSMYPGGAKIIQEYVMEACDRLDYDSSPMYDEYPDPLMVDRLCDNICDTVLSSREADILRTMWCEEEETEEKDGEYIDKNRQSLENMQDISMVPLNDTREQKIKGQELERLESDRQGEMFGVQQNRPGMRPSGPPRPGQPWIWWPGRPWRPGEPWNWENQPQWWNRPGQIWWDGMGHPGPRPPHPGPRPPHPGPRPPHPGPRPPHPGPRPPHPGSHPPYLRSQSMSSWNRRDHRRRPSWLRDMVKVLLLHEMHGRRCRRGICRF